MKNLELEVKILPLILSGSLTICGILGFGYSKNQELNKQLITSYEKQEKLEIQLKDITQQRDNLQYVNENGIQEISNKISVIEKRQPGMGGMLNQFKLFLDRTRRFNDAPESTNEAAEIVKEAQLYPGNLDRLQTKYMHDAHGIQNYEFVHPFFKIPFEEDALVYITSDWGLRKNILIDKKGNEKYLGSNLHEGYDLISTKKRIVAQYQYEVVLYGDFHNLPDGDRYKELYGGLGRTAVLRRKAVHEGTFYGYYHDLFGHLAEDRDIPYKPGDIIYPGETIGIIGNSGTASMGEHLHLGVYFVNDAKKPIPTDIFVNKTYGIEGMPENVLYFFE